MFATELSERALTQPATTTSLFIVQQTCSLPQHKKGRAWLFAFESLVPKKQKQGLPCAAVSAQSPQKLSPQQKKAAAAACEAFAVGLKGVYKYTSGTIVWGGFVQSYNLTTSGLTVPTCARICPKNAARRFAEAWHVESLRGSPQTCVRLRRQKKRGMRICGYTCTCLLGCLCRPAASHSAPKDE